MEYLALSSDAPGTEPLVLIDGPPYAPWVVIGDIEVGPVQWDTSFGSPYGTRGAAVAGDRVGNRTMVMTLKGTFDSKAEASGYENQLAAVLDEMRRFGGWVTYRVHGGTRRAHWRVLARDYSMEPWGQRFDRVNELRPRLAFTVEPYIYGDPMDHDDQFTDGAHAGRYTFINDGSAVLGDFGDLTVTNGEIAPVSVSPVTTYPAIHTDTGYDLGDVEATIRLSWGALTASAFAGVILKYVDANNMLAAYVKNDAGTWKLFIDKREGGTWTSLANTTITTPTVANAYWVTGRIEGGVVTCEWGSGIHPVGASNTATTILSGSALTTFGPTGVGKTGWYWQPRHAGDRLYRFISRPFTYKTVNYYPIEVCGDIPGTAPAVLEVDYSGTDTSPWHLLAWSTKPRTWNRVHNSGFEGPNIAGWTIAGVTGVTGAASSITDTDGAAYSGTAYGQVVTSAAANRGAAFRIGHRFTRGRTYRLRLRVRAASATTNVRARLGVSGDIASSTAVALTTSWVEHVVDWTPAATVDLAYAAVETTAATATTFQVDAVEVYEQAAGAPTVNRTRYGIGGAPAWGILHGLAALDGSPSGAFGAPTTLAVRAGVENYAQLDASVAAGGETYVIGWPIDPSLIPQDDHAGTTRDVEVWARLLLANQFTGGVTAIASIEGRIFTYEWGSDGVNLIMPPASGGPHMRLCRLGTLPVPDLTGEAVAAMLRIDLTVAAGTNAQPIGVAWVALVNPRARVCNPTGLDYDSGLGYPSLAYVDNAHVNSEGVVTTETVGRSYRIGSYSGAIEIPSGPVEVLSLPSSHVPDAPTTVLADSTAHNSRGVHLAVRPRFEFLIAEE